MVINAFNSGADACMSDFEDSQTPNWDSQVGGQINLMEAVRGTITLEQKGKSYKLKVDAPNGDNPTDVRAAPIFEEMATSERSPNSSPCRCTGKSQRQSTLLRRRCASGALASTSASACSSMRWPCR